MIKSPHPIFHKSQPQGTGRHGGNIMIKQALTKGLAGLAILGSSALISCTNPKSSNPTSVNSDTIAVENIGVDNGSSFSDTTIVAYIGNDTDFAFLVGRGSQPYMTISINFGGQIMAYWGDEEHRKCYFDSSIDELRQIILDRFESGDKPKDNELFHVGFDASTPKNLISALKNMLQEIGVHHCELSEIHNMLKLNNESKTPPPPPHAITYSDITEDEFKAEEVAKEAETDEIFFTAEQQPEFPGGMTELMKFLQKSINYPVSCKKEGIQGRVIVQFVINKDGSICEANVVKPVHPQLDAEAIRVINAMPNWTPGKQKGERVRVRYTLPVSFRL